MSGGHTLPTVHDNPTREEPCSLTAKSGVTQQDMRIAGHQDIHVLPQ